MPSIPPIADVPPSSASAANISSIPSDVATPAAPVGRIWNSRGAPSYHGRSYFGHQAAADLMHIESPQLPIGMGGIFASHSRRSVQTLSYRSDQGLYNHIWELIGYLPRRKTVVDHLVHQFLDELNPVYDGVHEATFLAKYDDFWNKRRGDDDLAAIDLRWLALLFIVLAFGELLCYPPDASAETQGQCEEYSLQLYWASRKTIVIAPTFLGESPDLVRAGILVTKYLVCLGRKTESWLTSSFAIRMAQAQGMHIDGASWGLPPKVLETRRRLWSALYSLDHAISLAIGRPYTINSRHCMAMHISNVWLDDMTDEEAAAAVADGATCSGVAAVHPESDPTPGLYYLYQQHLASLLGQIHDECFGLAPLATPVAAAAYQKVLELDPLLLAWAADLPPYFSLDQPDCSLDEAKPFLYWQRLYLHSSFYCARVTLHRTFALLEGSSSGASSGASSSACPGSSSSDPRYTYSRDACIHAAAADVRLKLETPRSRTMADRLRAGVAMHNLFSSALVLGILAVRDPLSPRTDAILRDLAAYCAQQNADVWANDFSLAEVRVLELCIASVEKARAAEGPPSCIDPSSSSSSSGFDAINNDWVHQWFGPTRSFPEPVEFELWENLVGTLEARQEYA